MISLSDFLNTVKTSIYDETFVRMIISQKRNQNSDIKSVIVKPIIIKKGALINFVYRYSTKDITKNYSFEESMEIIIQLISNEFNQVLFDTKLNEYHFSAKTNKAVVKSIEIEEAKIVDLSHDKTKKRLIDTTQNVYLQELGILDNEWRVKPSMQDKYKQINKYIEIIEGIIKNINVDRSFSIVDMGSGKGYLTFALYDYLSRKMVFKPTITGVEIRQELVDKCNLISKKCGFEKLNFIQGSIKETELSSIDILIALHACDTATDEAIAQGITKNAKVIVCAPCCHKQIRSEINPIDPIAAITEYGILKERQAEILTDTIRALILEAFGYKTNVFEFIETEHTPKNVLIVGISKGVKSQPSIEIIEKIAELKKIFGVRQHHLEKLLSI